MHWKHDSPLIKFFFLFQSWIFLNRSFFFFFTSDSNKRSSFFLSFYCLPKSASCMCLWRCWAYNCLITCEFCQHMTISIVGILHHRNFFLSILTMLPGCLFSSLTSTVVVASSLLGPDLMKAPRQSSECRLRGWSSACRCRCHIRISSLWQLTPCWYVWIGSLRDWRSLCSSLSLLIHSFIR